MRIKGPRGNQFFINRESVTRYAEELRQIEAVASLGEDTRHDAPQHAVARYSMPERDKPVEVATSASQREPDEADTVRRLKTKISICASTIAPRNWRSGAQSAA